MHREWTEDEVKEVFSLVPDDDEYKDLFDLILWHREQMAHHAKTANMLSNAYLTLKTWE